MAQQFSEMVGEGMCPPENSVCLFFTKKENNKKTYLLRKQNRLVEEL